VEAEHHLIVAHEVTNVGNDRTQLLAMGQQAQDVMACEETTALADRGYFNGDEVLACEGTGVLPCVPKTLTSGNAKRGLFTGQDFVYDAEHDHYTCPAGQHLTKGKVRSDRRDTIDHYRNLTACSTCALKPPDGESGWGELVLTHDGAQFLVRRQLEHAPTEHFDEDQVTVPVEGRSLELESFLRYLEPRLGDRGLQAPLRRRNRGRSAILGGIGQLRDGAGPLLCMGTGQSCGKGGRGDKGTFQVSHGSFYPVWGVVACYALTYSAWT
jgi:hypothetical protein